MQPFRILSLHATDVPLIVTTRHEFRVNHLFQHRRMNVAGHARLYEPVHQIAWNDQKAQAQRRKQSLAESPRIDDTSVRIERMQAR